MVSFGVVESFYFVRQSTTVTRRILTAKIRHNLLDASAGFRATRPSNTSTQVNLLHPAIPSANLLPRIFVVDFSNRFCRRVLTTLRFLAVFCVPAGTLLYPHCTKIYTNCAEFCLRGCSARVVNSLPQKSPTNRKSASQICRSCQHHRQRHGHKGAPYIKPMHLDTQHPNRTRRP